MNALKKRRMAANMTQAEVARAMRINQTAVSQWETGATRPRIANLLKLTALYKCTLNDLIEDESA